MNDSHVRGSSSPYLPKLSTKKLCDIFPHLYIIAIGATIYIYDYIYLLFSIHTKKSVWTFSRTTSFAQMSWKTLSPQACLKSPEELREMPPYPPTEGIGIVYNDPPAIHSEYVSQPFQSASSKSNPDLQVIEVGIILSTSALGKFQKFLRKQIGHTDTCLLRHKGARRRHRIHKQI